MADYFTSTNTLAPATGFIAVAPSDSVDLAKVARAILVTVAGNLNLMAIDGTTSGAFAVTAGQEVHVMTRRVMATGTTATVLGLA